MKKNVAGLAMEHVLLDIFLPLPLMALRIHYALVMSDYFTKWVEAMVLPDQGAKNTAEAFVTHFVKKFDAQIFMPIDQGCNFEAKLF